MKMWKRTAAFVLCAGFAFSGVACNVGGQQSNNSSNNSSAAPITPPETTTAQKFTEWADGVKTAKVEFNASFATKENYANDNGQLVSEPITATVEGEVVLAWTDSGVNAEFDATIGGTVIEGAKVTVEGCLVDGVAYLDQGAGMYRMIYDIGTVLEEAMAETGITEEQISAFGDVIVETVKKEYKDIDAAFDAIFEDVEAEEGVKTVTEDGSAWINALLAYIKTLDVENTTVVEAIDGVLKMINPAWTTEKIFDEVTEISEMKVADAYKAIDEAVKAETDKTVQEWKDALIANEEIAAILEEEMGKEVVDQIKAVDIQEDIIAEIGEMTVDQFVSSMVNEGGEEETEPALVIATYIAQAEAYLAEMTVADLGLPLEEIGELVFNKLSASASVKYDEDQNIEYVSSAFEVNVAYKEAVYVSEEESIEADNFLKAAVEVKVSEVGKTAPTIALPDDAVIVYSCAECGKEGDAETIKYYADVVQYLCEDCYEEWNTPRCFSCYTAENVTYYEDVEEYFCADCYVAWNTPSCLGCGTQENITYYEEDDAYFCESCYEYYYGMTEIPCCVCGEYDCVGHE